MQLSLAYLKLVLLTRSNPAMISGKFLRSFIASSTALVTTDTFTRLKDKNVIWSVSKTKLKCNLAHWTNKINLKVHSVTFGRWKLFLLQRSLGGPLWTVWWHPGRSSASRFCHECCRPTCISGTKTQNLQQTTRKETELNKLGTTLGYLWE